MSAGKEGFREWKYKSSGVGVKMHGVLGDLLVILRVWNIESMLQCAAAEAG